jgi:hypothetical protein
MSATKTTWVAKNATKPVPTDDGTPFVGTGMELIALMTERFAAAGKQFLGVEHDGSFVTGIVGGDREMFVWRAL